MKKVVMRKNALFVHIFLYWLFTGFCYLFMLDENLYFGITVFFFLFAVVSGLLINSALSFIEAVIKMR